MSQEQAKTDNKVRYEDAVRQANNLMWLDGTSSPTDAVETVIALNAKSTHIRIYADNPIYIKFDYVATNDQLDTDDYILTATKNHDMPIPRALRGADGESTVYMHLKGVTATTTAVVKYVEQ